MVSNAAPDGPVDVSVVIPAYNEEESVGSCVDEVAAVMDGLGRPYEIIVIDDGSTDATFSVLAEKRQVVASLVVLQLDTNHGQTAAFDAGFRAARGAAIVTLDADLQNDPADIPLLLSHLVEFDVVCGYRRERHDSAVRRASSRIANWVRNKLTQESIRDVGCSLRVMRAECVAGLKLYDGMHRFLPTLLRLDGWTVTEVAVNHRPRQWGTAKYGIGNRLFRGLRDLMAVRWMRSRWLRYRVVEKLK